MPTRRNKVKRTRQRFRSELDWFAEDPWAEPGLQEDEVEVSGEWEADEDFWITDDEDSWGPIRPRRESPE